MGQSRRLLSLPKNVSLISKLYNLTSKMGPIKTFVFMDLETTGLPHLEHNLTRITELCAVAVQADHIGLGCFPRVHNKISFCFNPERMICPESTNITGLSNYLLEHQCCFSSDIVDVINKWIDMNQRPICLVAHNGKRFDYPILRAEVEKTGNSLPDDLLCVDSLYAFRHIDKHLPVKESPKEVAESTKELPEPPKQIPFEFDDEFDQILCEATDAYERSLTPQQVQKVNETTPKKQMISEQKKGGSRAVRSNFRNVKEFVSYKLEDVYARVTSNKPINAHEAEGDVVMLMTSAATYGDKFVEYANENWVKLVEVPVMKPGKKIGDV